MISKLLDIFFVYKKIAQSLFGVTSFVLLELVNQTLSCVKQILYHLDNLTCLNPICYPF